MEKRSFSQLNVCSSLLGFGAMRLPLINGQIDEIQSLEMVDFAYSHGINYFDTAWFYHDGESEKFLGKALKKYERKTFYLATKMPVSLVTSQNDVESFFEQQLKKLDTDYFDFYLLHAINSKRYQTVKEFKIIEFLEAKKREGKIKHLGFSFHGEYEEFKEILNDYSFDFVQIQLNYMDIEFQQGLKGYKLLEERNIPVIIMEPLKGGLLANLPIEAKRIINLNQQEKSDASYALRYAASFKNVLTVLSGMSTLEQLKENVQTFSQFIPFSKKENERIQEVKKVIEGRIKVNCTDCKYCMPCPYGVNIPLNFKVYNQYFMYNNIEGFKNTNEIKEEMHLSHCKKCKICEAKCPQHIQISYEFEKIVQEKI